MFYLCETLYQIRFQVGVDFFIKLFKCIYHVTRLIETVTKNVHNFFKGCNSAQAFSTNLTRVKSLAVDKLCDCLPCLGDLP